MTDIAAFGASEQACYEYPDDTEIARAQRVAFCAGSAWAGAEIERLRAEIRRLRDALEIIAVYTPYPDPDDGKTVLDHTDIARRALEEK